MELTQNQKYRSTEQERKSRDKPMDLIYDKGGKNIQWRKDSLFSKWCWENQRVPYKRMNSEHSLTLYENKLKMN